MDITTFKNTEPTGISLLISGSEQRVRAVTISIDDCNLNNLNTPLSVLSSFTTIVNSIETTFYVTNTELISPTHYYYDIDTGSYSPQDYPTFNTSSTSAGVCYTVTTDPEANLGFLGTDADVLLGEASNLRRASYIFEVDRREDNINPTNLTAILSESAVTAEVQDSSYSSNYFTRPRFDGVKLNSGSLYYDDPALIYISFQASVHGSSVSYKQITAIPDSERKITTLYFNPDLPNSKQSIPSIGKPIYLEDGNKFIRLENKKFYIVESGLLGQIGTGSANIAPTFDRIITPSFQTTGSSTGITGSYPTATTYNYDISNYSFYETGFVQYVDANNVYQNLYVPADTDISICAITIISSTGVVISQDGVC